MEDNTHPMSRHEPSRSNWEHQREYAAMLKQIRFTEFAATCARSARLQVAAGELRSTARQLVRISQKLRRVRPGGHHEI